MIEINNLTYRYNRKKILFEGLSLELMPGKVYGLLGKNGAGKSSLIKNIAGLLLPSEGDCLVDGRESSARQTGFLEQLFFVPEESELPRLQIPEFLEIYAPFYPTFDEKQFYDNLQTFNVDSGSHLQQLSFGQRKKAYIAFALATNTRVLIMDEPTNGLDIPSKIQFRKMVSEASRQDKITIISTHQVRDLDDLITAVLVMDDSRILLHADKKDISANLYFSSGEREGHVYEEATATGVVSMSLNPGGMASYLDLEVLFNATLKKGDWLKSLEKARGGEGTHPSPSQEGISKADESVRLLFASTDIPSREGILQADESVATPFQPNANIPSAEAKLQADESVRLLSRSSIIPSREGKGWVPSPLSTVKQKRAPKLPLLFKRQFFENRKLYIIAALGLTGILLFLFFVTWHFRNSFSGGTNQGIFLIGLFLGGSLFTSTLLKDLNQPSRGIWLMALPASIPQKLFVCIIYSVAFYLIAFLGIFFLTETLFNWIVGENSVKMEIKDLWKNGFHNFFFTFLNIQLLVLLGSLSFKRAAFIKTIIVLLTFFLLVNTMNNALLAFITGETSINGGAVFDYFQFVHSGENVYIYLPDHWQLIIGIIFHYLVPAIIFYIIYHKFKETEI